MSDVIDGIGFNVIRCDKCGEEIDNWSRARRVGQYLFCHVCVAVYDIPRFRELPPQKQGESK